MCGILLIGLRHPHAGRLSGLHLDAMSFYQSWAVAVSVVPLVTGVALIGAAVLWRRDRAGRAVLLCAALYFVAMVVELHLLTLRYFLHFVPLLMLLAVLGLSHLGTALENLWRGRGRRLALVSLLVLLLGTAAEVVLVDGPHGRWEARDAAGALGRRVSCAYRGRRPDDVWRMFEALKRREDGFDACLADVHSQCWYYWGDRVAKLRMPNDTPVEEAWSAISAARSEVEAGSPVLIVMLGRFGHRGTVAVVRALEGRAGLIYPEEERGVFAWSVQ